MINKLFERTWFPLVSGLVFSRNTFCAHICPVGHLLGLYARLAPMGWRSLPFYLIPGLGVPSL